MKKIITLKKNIEFPSMIGEITAISLDHTLKFVDESNITGEFKVSGNYKLTEASRLEENNIHIHFPEGAVSKDGPSAGIAITSALISVFTKKTVNFSIAMTGEITLHGRVLAIGGLKEKVIGAHRAGIKTVYLPVENEKDIEEIPLDIRNDIKFHYVSNYSEIYNEIFNK